MCRIPISYINNEAVEAIWRIVVNQHMTASTLKRLAPYGADQHGEITVALGNNFHQTQSLSYQETLVFHLAVKVAMAVLGAIGAPFYRVSGDLRVTSPHMGWNWQ